MKLSHALLILVAAAWSLPATATTLTITCSALGAGGQPQAFTVPVPGIVQASALIPVPLRGANASLEQAAGFQINVNTSSTPSGIALDGALNCTELDHYQTNTAAGVAPTWPVIKGIRRPSLHLVIGPAAWKVTEDGVTVQISLTP